MRAKLRSVNQAQTDRGRRVFLELEILDPTTPNLKRIFDVLGSEVGIETHASQEVVNFLGHEVVHSEESCPQCNLEAR